MSPIAQKKPKKTNSMQKAIGKHAANISNINIKG